MPRNQLAEISAIMGMYGGGGGGAIGGYEPFPAGPVLDQGGRKGITYGAPPPAAPSIPIPGNPGGRGGTAPGDMPIPGNPVRDPQVFPQGLQSSRPEYNPLPFDVWVRSNGRQNADPTENMQVYNLYIQTYQNQFQQAMDQFQAAEEARQAKGHAGPAVGQTVQQGPEGPRPRYGPHGEPLQFGFANNVTNVKTWHG